MAIMLRETLPEGATIEATRELGEEMNVRGDVPDGLLAHGAYLEDGRVHIVDFWESEAAFERFRESRLIPAAGKVLPRHGFDASVMAQVETTIVDLEDVVVRG